MNKKIKGMILILSILALSFLVAAFSIFFVALPDTENQPYGPIPLFIGGLICIAFATLLIFGIYHIIEHYKIISSKLKIINFGNSFKIAYLISFLFGALFIWLGANQIIEYKEKSNTYLEVQGRYINSIKKDYGDDISYYLVYEYQVGENLYKITTDYSTDIIPEYGSEKTVLYNPEAPDDALIKDEMPIVLIVFGAIFIIIPYIVLKKFMRI